MRGIENLVDLVDRSIRLNDVDATVDAIKGELCRLIRTGGIEIPEEVTRPVEGHYARRLLHRDDDLGYSIVAMTWGPGQATAIHDHSGMWCIEGVWAGSINVRQYELTERDDAERYRFESRNSYEAGPGSAGCLIPPYEYHLIENNSDEGTAVSLHIYGGEMLSCQVFEPEGNGWYRSVERPLSYDQ